VPVSELREKAARTGVETIYEAAAGDRETWAGAKGPAGRVPDIVGIGDFKNLTNAGAWLDFDIIAAHLVSVAR
jgi:hypothetical protein